MDRLTVAAGALPGFAAASRAAAVVLEPGSLADACEQAVAGLGQLASAALLAELAAQLARSVAAVQARWWAMATATGAAAERYAGVEAAITQAEGAGWPVGGGG